MVVRFHDADRTVASGRYDVETPHLSCIARFAVMDGAAVKAVFTDHHGESKNSLYANTATSSSLQPLAHTTMRKEDKLSF